MIHLLFRLVAALALALALAFPAAAATLETMAVQMIIVGFQGNDAEDASVRAVRDELAAGRIGGVMFLKTNVRSLDAVTEMNRQFAAASRALRPFLTLDQEGGAVERLTKAVGFNEVPSARAVAATNTPSQAEKLYGRMAASIAKLGFTLSFGPVADMDINPDNPIIAKFGRSFAADPKTVAAFDEAFVTAHRAAGLLTAIKHFPGHGSSSSDSHEGFVDITETWKADELEPYRKLIAAGDADMIMIGHLFHAGYSGGDTRLPASLSPEWIGGVLRRDLGFDGVVISDDLEMGAIREHFGLADTVRRAVRAGMDVLLFSNTAKYRPGLGREILDILVAEAGSDPAFARRIEQSYNRIVALKTRIH